MKESYDISMLFKIFKRILKSGPDFYLRRKMRVNRVIWLSWNPHIYTTQVNPIHTIFKYGDYYEFMDR